MGVSLSSLALLKSHFEFFDTFRVVTKNTGLRNNVPFIQGNVGEGDIHPCL